MAVDEAIARGVERDTSPPTVRAFGWTPPAVSFGYAQRIGREVDADRCRQRGIHLVRRPSGGRAVLHWNELTYSVACRGRDPLLGGAIQESYRKISACLVAGLQRLGVAARFEPRRTPVSSPRGEGLTSPCFSSTTQYEVTLDDRKIIGSAQRRLGGVLLQHGSLLLGPEHKRLIDLLPDRRQPLKERFRRELDRHTVSLSEAGRPADFDTVARALRYGFAKTPRRHPHRIHADSGGNGRRRTSRQDEVRNGILEPRRHGTETPRCPAHHLTSIRKIQRSVSPPPHATNGQTEDARNGA